MLNINKRKISKGILFFSFIFLFILFFFLFYFFSYFIFLFILFSFFSYISLLNYKSYINPNSNTNTIFSTTYGQISNPNRGG